MGFEGGHPLLVIEKLHPAVEFTSHVDSRLDDIRLATVAF